MIHEPTSTVRARRLRERRSRGVVMVAPVEVGVGGFKLLVANGLLKQHEEAPLHRSPNLTDDVRIHLFCGMEEGG